MENFYQILGVRKRASNAEIKRAFAKLARRYHPDINPGDMSVGEKYEAIAIAFEVLSNPKKKRQYDGLGHVEYTARLRIVVRDSGDGGGGELFEESSTLGVVENKKDILEYILDSRSNGDMEPQPGKDVERKLVLSFWEAANGANKSINVKYKIKCAKCLTSRTVKLLETPCRNCGGKGYTEVVEQVGVKIPPWSEHANRIKLPGKGEQGRNGGRDGDLYVTLFIVPHLYFWRRGRDLFMELPLSFYEAVLGAKINVPTADGSVLLSVPAGIQSGKKLRLKGKGLESPGGETRGDMYVIAKIMAPDAMSLSAREKFEELGYKYPYNPRETLEWDKDLYT